MNDPDRIASLENRVAQLEKALTPDSVMKPDEMGEWRFTSEIVKSIRAYRAYVDDMRANKIGKRK